MRKFKENWKKYLVVALFSLIILTYPLIIYAVGLYRKPDLAGIAFLLVLAGTSFLLSFICKKGWAFAYFLLWPIIVMLFKAGDGWPVILGVSFVPLLVISIFIYLGQKIKKFLNGAKDVKAK